MSNNHQVSVLKPYLFVLGYKFTKRTSLELSSLLSLLFFFRNSIFQIEGVAYLGVWLLQGLLHFVFYSCTLLSTWTWKVLLSFHEFVKIIDNLWAGVWPRKLKASLTCPAGFLVLAVPKSVFMWNFHWIQFPLSWSPALSDNAV